MEKESKVLKEHYERTFAEHGASAQGIDWGQNEENVILRYQKMLAVLRNSKAGSPFLLDVGCGFGGLLRYANEQGVKLSYSGIDVADNMITYAREIFPAAEFFCGDVLRTDVGRTFDYVVCNGILTQKLDIPALEMDEYANKLIKRMYDLCHKGIAFNVMSTKVNYFANNLYYRNPAELLAWCLSEISRHVKLDHSYRLYEYTMYLYREPEA